MRRTPYVYLSEEGQVNKKDWNNLVNKIIAIETITAASDTLDDTNYIVLCDCTSNSITINLPTAVGNSGLTYVIKKIDNTSNRVTIDANGAQTIDGDLTQTLYLQHETMTIVSNGTNYYII